MDPESGIDYYVTIDVEAAHDVEVAAAAAVGIMQCYRLAPDPPYPWPSQGRRVRVRGAR